jgi:2-amino-4-hydroxy-6-hydroxymethyldihydropteridine diphosphokinase
VGIYLSAGSNLGNREANLEFGMDSLRQNGIVPVHVSPFFETEPVGFLDQPWFLNLAFEVESRLSPRQLLEECLEIEAQRGRKRTFANQPRTLDLDILLYNSEVVSEEGLVIPHPRMAERRFVLEPLARIASGVVHPLLEKTIATLLDECPDRSVVKIYTGGGAG